VTNEKLNDLLIEKTSNWWFLLELLLFKCNNC